MTNPDFSHCPVISDKCDRKCPGLRAIHICKKIAAKDPGFTRLCVTRITGEDPGPFKTPGIITRAKSALKAGISYVASGMANVSQEIYNKRFSICESCDWFDEKIHKCNNCTCNIKIKAWMANQRCPLNPPKWDQEKIEGPGCGGCGSKNK